jgi:putative tricarboxylic transport membrane protein
MRLADLIGGLVVLLFGLAVTVFSLQLQYMSEYGPGPGFLPLWLGIGITACSLGVLYQTLRKHGATGAFFQPRTKIGVTMLAIIVGAFVLLPYLGFSVALGIFSFVSMRLIGKHGLLTCAITAVAAAIGIHYVFAEWLSIPLPGGIVDW